jgi:hypothetical protein
MQVLQVTAFDCQLNSANCHHYFVTSSAGTFAAAGSETAGNFPSDQTAGSKHQLASIFL